MRTHYCGQVTEKFVGQEVTVAGWVHRRRDHGGVIFIDLRDKSGLVQVVVDPEVGEIFNKAEHLRSECVLSITGLVRPRPEGTINPNMPTGQIEIETKNLDVLSMADPIPFQLDDKNVGEEVRLKYRYLDLRREEMQEAMIMRSKVTRAMRNFLDDNGFMDMETPILTKSTPEGARDYLVPSRTHEGRFFALPQSPQLFKQLLMMSGFDRYYQITRCFRDEDLRADRQPEFTQLDIETSFMNEEEVMQVMEDLSLHIFKAVGIELNHPYPRISYAEAMQKYGVDRPDLRNPLELVDVADLLQDIDFKVFAAPAKDPSGRVVALRVPQGGEISRKDIDDYTKYVGIYGAKGLAYIKVNDLAAGIDGLQSPIVKFFPDQVMQILERVGAENGDLVFFGADKAKVVNESMGALRVKLGEDLNLLTCEWAPVWVVDFPMFEKDDKTGRTAAVHHPFTQPQATTEEILSSAEPTKMLARAYDLVINGTEVGGGSVRIHDTAMQSAVFKLLGISDEEAMDKFGFLLNALRYGCPPHAGMAFGLDRLVMLMAKRDSIRDVIAFPKTQSAACLMTDAPGEVAFEQLRELNLRLNIKSSESNK